MRPTLTMSLIKFFYSRIQIKITGSWSILSFRKTKGLHLMYSKILRLTQKQKSLKKSKTSHATFWFQKLFVIQEFISTRCQDLDHTLRSNLNTSPACLLPLMTLVSKTTIQSKKREPLKMLKLKSGKSNNLRSKRLHHKPAERASIKRRKNGQRLILLISRLKTSNLLFA